ncbi:MAG: nuclear transport factor 2 family protein [Gemmatimonadaceae bacterium]
MKKLLLLSCAVSGMACAASPVPRPAMTDPVATADRAAVIAAVQSLFDAMRTRDTSAIRAAFAPNAQLVSVRTVAGAAPRMQVQPLAAFVTSIGRAPEELVERMWDPRVEVAGDLASLWAPYDFRIGASFSHCGHDAVHLVRTPEGWKVTGIAYTVITTGCATQ